MNGKGKGPEKGRNHSKFLDGYDGINWKKPERDPFMDELATKGMSTEAAAIHYDNLSRLRKAMRIKLQEVADAVVDKTKGELGKQ